MRQNQCFECVNTFKTFPSGQTPRRPLGGVQTLRRPYTLALGASFRGLGLRILAASDIVLAIYGPVDITFNSWGTAVV